MSRDISFLVYSYVKYSADEHRLFSLKPPVSLSYVWVKQAVFGFTLGQKGSKAFTQVSDSKVQYKSSLCISPHTSTPVCLPFA